MREQTSEILNLIDMKNTSVLGTAFGDTQGLILNNLIAASDKKEQHKEVSKLS